MWTTKKQNTNDKKKITPGLTSWFEQHDPPYPASKGGAWVHWVPKQNNPSVQTGDDDGDRKLTTTRWPPS